MMIRENELMMNDRVVINDNGNPIRGRIIGIEFGKVQVEDITTKKITSHSSDELQRVFLDERTIVLNGFSYRKDKNDYVIILEEENPNVFWTILVEKPKTPEENWKLTIRDKDQINRLSAEFSSIHQLQNYIRITTNLELHIC